MSQTLDDMSVAMKSAGKYSLASIEVAGHGDVVLQDELGILAILCHLATRTGSYGIYEVDECRQVAGIRDINARFGKRLVFLATLDSL